jgi:hypothetical protein
VSNNLSESNLVQSIQDIPQDLREGFTISGKPDLCGQCKKERPCHKYSHSGGVMEVMHGIYNFLCEQCITENQIAFAKERAEAIPDLEAKLAKIIEGYGDDD